MATYTLGAQNNNQQLNIPDEGQIFTGTGARLGENNAIYKRVGNTIVQLAAGAGAAGNNPNDPTRLFENTYGAGSYDKIARYNLGDIQTAFNNISPGFTLYGAQAGNINDFNPGGAVSAGTSFTQQAGSQNAQGYDLYDNTGKQVYSTPPVSANKIQNSAPTAPFNAQQTNMGAVGPTNDPSGMNQGQSDALKTAMSGGPAVPQQAAPGAPATSQQAQGGPGITTALQPGNTGPEVQKLQDFLVSQGLMSQNDLAGGGYGTYGPKTTAAVAALQQKLGVDNSSGVGYFGPKTMAALQSSGIQNGSGSTGGATSTAQTGQPQAPGTDTGKTPDQNLQSAYTEILRSNGSSDIKAQAQKYVDEQKNLTDSMNTEIAEVRNNPWLSQSEVERRVEKVQNKYETKLNTASNFASLYQTLYKDAIADAQFRVGLVQADQKAAIERAQAKQDALDALGKYHDFVEAGGRKLLVDKNTGKIIADLGAANVGGSGGGFNNQSIDNERGLLSQFKGEQIVKDYNVILGKKQVVDQILNSKLGGPGDLAVVYEFMKALDPTSVVRETEYASAAKSGNIFSGAYAQFNGYLKPEGGFLPDQVKSSFQNIINSKLQVQQAQYDNVVKEYQNVAQRQGLNPQNVTINYGAAAQNNPAAAQRYNPGEVIVNNHTMYLVGADGQTITPIGSAL